MAGTIHLAVIETPLKMWNKFDNGNSKTYFQSSNTNQWFGWHINHDSKVHGVYMVPIWSWEDPGGPHVGPMNFAICELKRQ